MYLTLREAAELMRVRPRTLRDQLRRGLIPGVKRENRWRIRKADLPLRDADHRHVHHTLGRFHDAVDRGVPARVKADVGLGTVEQLDAFTLAREVLDVIGDVHPAARARVREALFAIARGHHQFARAVKLTAFDAARDALSAAVVELLLGGAEAAPIVRRIELEALPRLAGLIRWAEALPERRRGAA